MNAKRLSGGNPLRRPVWLALIAMAGAALSEAQAQPGWPSDPKVRQAVRTIEAVANYGPFKPEWASLTNHATPGWCLDARFGLSIHWGAYSVPAFGNEWYPRNMYLTNSPEYRHHLAAYGPPSRFGYKDFLPLFKAERFDARQWARLFRESGARYVLPVAEHYDGFPMYDCSYTEWSAAKMGPTRDILADLAAAVRREGLVFGASSHRAEHWWFMNGGAGLDSDVRDHRYAAFYGPARPEKATLTKEFMDDWLARSCEIVDRYRPQIVRFDRWVEQPALEPYRRTFAAYYYNRAAQWSKGVAIVCKSQAFPENAAVQDVEGGQTDQIRPRFWQREAAVSVNSRGHLAGQEYRSVASIVHDLADIVSKNGSLLLSIRPGPDGLIAEPEARMLREIGRWLRVNGEAIHDTRPWMVCGEGPTRTPRGGLSDTQRRAFTDEDIRFTTRKSSIYALALGWPEAGRLSIRSLAKSPGLDQGNVRKVRLLGHGGALKWAQTEAGLEVALPSKPPCDHAYAFEILGTRLKPAPVKSVPIVRPWPDGSFALEADLAALHGEKLALDSSGETPLLAGWTEPGDFATWRLKCPKAGSFLVSAVYSAAEGATEFVLDGAGQPLTVKAPATPSWNDYQTLEAGRAEIGQPGEITLMMGPLNAAVWRPLRLQRLLLRPLP